MLGMSNIPVVNSGVTAVVSSEVRSSGFSDVNSVLAPRGMPI